MLNNLKLVLSQNRKILSIFFVVVFLPSIFLAFFGMRALRNEKFKIQQQTLEDQKTYVRTIQSEIQDSIEKISANLMDISNSEAILNVRYSEVRNGVMDRLKNELLFGEIVIWNKESEPWLPAYQSFPPTENPLIVPDEWTKIQTDLKAAEMAEFRQKNYRDAIVQYRRIENKVKNNQVKAWILNRIARCEIKRNEKKNALDIYRSLIDLYSDFFTESGRSLEFASRLEMLNILLSSGNYTDLYTEFVNSYRRLNEKAWSFDDSQVRLYAATLKKLGNEMVPEDSEQNIPDDFIVTIAELDLRIEEILEVWDLIESASRNVLAGAEDGSYSSNRAPIQIQKSAFLYNNQDVLLLLIPVDGGNPDSPFKFLGSLLRTTDLTKNSEILSAENLPQGFSILLRSNQTEDIIFGKENIDEKRPIFTDIFLDNFPPWRVELYQNEGSGSGFVLYKNIFFWINIVRYH